MQVKLTIGERLKDLRTAQKLSLEQLAAEVGISKSALGKYESDNGKDISPYSILLLVDYYGVSCDYLMGRTETKNHPNTALHELHLSDASIDVLKTGKFNHRLLSELICHKDFQRFMLDAEIYVDRIADMRVNDMNAVLEAGTWAPTGMGRQSPVIVCIQNKADRDTLSKMNAAAMGGNGDPFYGAPCVAVVLVDKTIPTCVEDGSLVMGNMLNAAESVGLSACWIHRAKEMFETAEGQALLKKWGVPNAENLRGVGNCILGYAAEGGKKAPAPRKENYVVLVK